MIKNFSRKNQISYSKYNQRFPLWVSLFFFLIFSIPILSFFDFKYISKIIGVLTLFLIIFAMRFWLTNSKKFSNVVNRVVLNKNQIFELDRKYLFFKRLNYSQKRILVDNTGIILAETGFLIFDSGIPKEDLIDIAFNMSILLFDKSLNLEDFSNLKTSSILIKEQKLSLNSLPEVNSFYSLEVYVKSLRESDFGKSFQKLVLNSREFTNNS